MPEPGEGPDGFLVREIVQVAGREAPASLTLQAAAVGYWNIPGSPGVVTGEPAAVQGVRRGPQLGGRVEAYMVEQEATIVIRRPGPNILRLTLTARRGWRPSDDGDRWGMLPQSSPLRRLAAPTTAPLEWTTDPDSTLIQAGNARLRVAHSPFAWTLTTSGGGEAAASGGGTRQAMGFPLAPALCFGEGWVSASLALRPFEVICGMGEQAGPVAKNGQRLVAAVGDAMGTGTGLTYKAAPLFHSSEGYSLFVHSPGPVEFDVGARFSSVLQVTCPGHVLDLFFFTGDGLSDRLESYTELTGRMNPVPPWALGVWMSRCRYRDRRELLEAAGGMRQHGIACDVMHLDPSWLERDVLSCDFEWNKERFGDPAELVDEMRSLGMKLSLWECPYLDPLSPLAGQAASADMLLRDASGNPAEVTGTFSRDGRPRWIVDFTNPAARRWWRELHEPLLKAGVSTFTADFGDGIPDSAVPHIERTKSRSATWRNLYPLWYHATVSAAIAEGRREPPVLLARSGWAGSQRSPAQWSGDAESTPSGMATTLRAGLSWALSAPGMWGHDIGGFFGPYPGDEPSPELYVRWSQFGCLSPLTRFHGLTAREPWYFGERAVDIVRRFVDLRYSLLPYLQSAMLTACATGIPVMRPMPIEMPDELIAWQLDSQYLLGPDILVVPVCSDSVDEVEVPVVVPPGSWVDILSGEAATGLALAKRRVPLERIPLLVRGGAVIAMAGRTRSEADAAELTGSGWILHLWPGPARETFVRDTAGVCRYRPSDVHGRICDDPDEITSIVVDEPVARAARGLLHMPDGTVRDLSLIRVRRSRSELCGEG